MPLRTVLHLLTLTVFGLLAGPVASQPAPVPLDGAGLDSMLEASGVAAPQTPVVRDTVRSPAAVPAASVAAPAAVPDSLLGELALLRAAVAGLAARNDSLATALATRQGRVDTVVVRDTSAVKTAQKTLERVGEEASDAIQNFVPKLILSILLIVLSLYLVRGIVWLLESLAAQSAERRLFYKKLIPIVRLLVWALTVYLVITAVFQIPSNSLLAAAAAIGVAIGFAAQEVLKNIFGGIVIILDQPFQVGDKIAIGNTYGEVVSIGLRSTRIVTPDDNLVSVPNSQVVADQVANANAGELNLQVVTDLWLPGWIDVALAKRIAYEAAANSKYVYLNKPIVVIVKDEFKETFLLHIKVKAYVLDTRYEFLLMSDVTEAAKVEFLRCGLLQPMPLVGAYVDALHVMNEATVAERSGISEAPSGDTANGAPPDAEHRAVSPAEAARSPELPSDTA